MRIISGNHKGRKIIAPKNLPVRPTTDRAKESLFNILQNRYNISKLKALDLFSGTGNISFEFASRNAKKITAVDKNIKCTNFINKMSLELDFNIKTITSDCFNYILNTSDKFDIIFLDPPYKEKALENINNKEAIANPESLKYFENPILISIFFSKFQKNLNCPKAKPTTSISTW